MNKNSYAYRLGALTGFGIWITLLLVQITGLIQYADVAGSILFVFFLCILQGLLVMAESANTEGY